MTTLSQVLQSMLGPNSALRDRNIVSPIDNPALYVLGNRYLKLDDMFTYPLPSSCLNEILASQLSPNLEAFCLIDVIWKAVRIPTTIPENGSFFVCPLLNQCF